MAKKDQQKPLLRRVFGKMKRDQENGARRAVLEDLFYDFNRSRLSIYKLNFVRGIFLGLGTAIGGTIVVALLIWVLSMLSNYIPPLHDFFNGAAHTIQSSKK